MLEVSESRVELRDGLRARPRLQSVYRDENAPGTVLLQLNVESFERAKGWFSDERFRAAVKRAGRVERDIYMATPKTGS